MTERTIFTVGHSTRSFEEFLELLKAHNVEAIADARSLPGSRRYPQFDSENLEPALAQAHIAYRWYPNLGGRRRGANESKNLGWRNASFRAYADSMGTKDFKEGIAHLEGEAGTKRVAIMCAEAVPWRCHRSLIADALLVAGWKVFDIMTPTSAPPHKPTPFLQVHDGELTYPTAS